ncbi:MAG: superinfection exclusion B family protein [Stagnimonas sp.]|nr:superinfection exclusion B family protein [Stagnimonas sp.]
MVDLSRLTDWLKLPTKTLVALSIVGAILLFSPTSLLTSLGLETFVNSYRPYIGAMFVVSLTIVAVTFVSSVLKFIHPWVVQAYWIHGGRKRLRSLNPEEKELLLHFIQNRTRSQHLPIQSGVVSALVQEKILLRATGVGDIYGFDYNIQPWAWEYLNENPHLLR